MKKVLSSLTDVASLLQQMSFGVVQLWQMNPLSHLSPLGCWRSMKAHRYRLDESYLRPSSEWRLLPWNMLHDARLAFLAQLELGLVAHQAHARGSMIQTCYGGFDLWEGVVYPAIDLGAERRGRGVDRHGLSRD